MSDCIVHWVPVKEGRYPEWTDLPTSIMQPRYSHGALPKCPPTLQPGNSRFITSTIDTNLHIVL